MVGACLDSSKVGLPVSLEGPLGWQQAVMGPSAQIGWGYVGAEL